MLIEDAGVDRRETFGVDLLDRLGYWTFRRLFNNLAILSSVTKFSLLVGARLLEHSLPVLAVALVESRIGCGNAGVSTVQRHVGSGQGSNRRQTNQNRRTVQLTETQRSPQVQLHHVLLVVLFGVAAGARLVD